MHICERHNKTASDRVPRTLVDPCPDAHAAEDKRIRNMCTALGHMRRLHTFTWAWEVSPPGPPTVRPEHENMVLNMLARKKTLRHVGLSGCFGLHAPGVAYDPDSMLYPVCIFLMSGCGAVVDADS